jgi:CheY-like chemotaxis protein
MPELPNEVRAKILIAEDDTIVALDLQGMLMRLGYDVVAIVDSGQAAIASARRFQPDIILLDMVLNGSLDGIEVAREIHKTNDIPVVFCVSGADLSILVRAKEISYAGYLLKPINPDTLATTLDTVLYKYKLELRVRKVEEKFQALSDKCRVADAFFDQNAAFGWTWSESSGAKILCSENCELLPVKVLEEKISVFVSLRLKDRKDSDAARLSFLVEAQSSSSGSSLYASIAIIDRERGTVFGMLMPLSGDSA